MNRYLRHLILALLGVLAPLWWTWSSNQLHYQIYLLAGSPDHPSQLYGWTAILGISFTLGLLPGAFVFLLMRQSPFRGWVIFWAFLLIGTAIFGTIFGALGSIIESALSAGTWNFVLGSAAVPLLTRRSASEN
ncbi:hypothetical protein RCH09_003603 [Actimicrobium sp. GrIS 1.19]|uniref:hypothetical protein n=1 Tax=Actimicrobium sp. GrIS 1.19 TaxID=3071708 RepID=UPI002DFF9F09|nr:hypothetical protein [Actimicrobium sp. GrIS 1.19]